MNAPRPTPEDEENPMIIVMAAHGSADGVRSPKHTWCFSAADARRVTDSLTAEYQADNAVEVFSVDFPEVEGSTLRDVAWRKTAEDCTRMALAMYLKHKQAPEDRQDPKDARAWADWSDDVPLRRAA